MNKQRSLYLPLFILLSALAACSPSEQQLREIVRDELLNAGTRKPILDAKTIGPYSPAQKVGNFLFLSGQIGINQETGQLENATIETETRQALFNMMSVLHAAGYDSSDVVSTTVYLKDIADFTRMNAVYATYFQQSNYPARATIQVAALPRDAKIEISAIAYKTKK